MPKSKVQNVLFTIVMAFVMVYALVCYNIALDKGGMSNEIFLIAFHEIVIMLPVAFVLEFFIVARFRPADDHASHRTDRFLSHLLFLL
mgnify:CR=1 FL=1